MPASDAMIDDQRDVIAFLSDPASYDPRPTNVQRIETHGAQVFLTAGDVFKIKRAVRYPYLDFSTLEKRHTACARELQINSPNAPMIYKRLAAITREADGRLAFDGRGEVVEWAVQMVRFREEDVLANRIARSPLTTDEAKSLADAVYDSHLRAAVIETPPHRASTANIAADVLAALPSLFAPADQTAIQVLTARLTALVANVQPLLERRASEGHVRRCHGDLHLANIVLLEGRPTLFDAIEFDETLATTDTLYDLAFLLMDLDKRGQRLTANIVLNRYLWRTQDMSDLDGLAALPVFLALRLPFAPWWGRRKRHSQVMS